MAPNTSERPFTSLPDWDFAARCHHFECQATRSIVLVRNELECFDAFCVSTFSDEEFGRFFEADDSYARNGHDEHEGARRVPDVAPSLVVGACARCCIREDGWVQTGEVRDEGPGEEAGDELADTY
jgi:hypothetical protein